MNKLNVPAGSFFGLLTLLQFATGNNLVAVATGLLAAGLLLSDVAYLTSPAKFVAGPLRTWRNLTSMLLVGASLGLSGYEAGGGLYRFTHASASEMPVK